MITFFIDRWKRGQVSLSLEGGTLVLARQRQGFRMLTQALGPDPACNARLVVLPPEGLSIHDFDGIPGAVAARGRINAAPGPLAPGATATLTVRLRPVFAGTHSLAATVASGLEDPDLNDNVVAPSIEVREGLTLQARLVDGRLELSWPEAEAAAILETSLTLQPPAWGATGYAPETYDGRRHVQIVAPTGIRYYRLRVP